MKRFILSISGCLFFCLLGLAQKRFITAELGLFSGVSNYMGDLQQVRFDKDELHEAYGVYWRYNFGKRVSLKLQAYKGVISGSDAHFKNLLTSRRNLSFRSDIFELGAQWEFSLTYFGEESRRMAAPYFFVGAAWFHFNPMARYQGEWVELQPLGTEGQGLFPGAGQPYKLEQWAIPLGVGFVLSLGRHLNLGFELGFRKTFTDYLDDVSGAYPDQLILAEVNPLAAALSYRTPEVTTDYNPNPAGTLRGNPQNKDLYFFGGLTFSWNVYYDERVKKP